MCIESAEDTCYVLSDMVIFASNWAVTMGDTQVKCVCKTIQAPKTGPCISWYYQLSGHCGAYILKYLKSMFIFKILRRENRILDVLFLYLNVICWWAVCELHIFIQSLTL